MTCVKDAIEEVEISLDRQAFLEYLSDAPSIDDDDIDATDSKTCGDLREYFEYDRNYPDDTRICREVLDLQVSERVTLQPLVQPLASSSKLHAFILSVFH